LGQRDAQVVVGRQGLFDQLRQQRIIEAAPEAGIVGDGRRVGGRRMLELRRHREFGPHEVRADRASRQQRGGERQRERADHHGSTWSK
jgi:hypothetical protein